MEFRPTAYEGHIRSDMVAVTSVVYSLATALEFD